MKRRPRQLLTLGDERMLHCELTRRGESVRLVVPPNPRGQNLVNVLIVDDDKSIGRLLRLILGLEGIEVSQAHSGEAAMDYLIEAEEHPDFILLDLAMPGMDGREVFREARRAGVSCPIVFCSSQGAAIANRELGGQGAIEKPFDPVEIVETVRSLTAAGQA